MLNPSYCFWRGHQASKLRPVGKQAMDQYHAEGRKARPTSVLNVKLTGVDLSVSSITP